MLTYREGMVYVDLQGGYGVFMIDGGYNGVFMTGGYGVFMIYGGYGVC